MSLIFLMTDEWKRNFLRKNTKRTNTNIQHINHAERTMIYGPHTTQTEKYHALKSQVHATEIIKNNRQNLKRIFQEI